MTTYSHALDHALRVTHRVPEPVAAPAPAPRKTISGIKIPRRAQPQPFQSATPARTQILAQALLKLTPPNPIQAARQQMPLQAAPQNLARLPQPPMDPEKAALPKNSSRPAATGAGLEPVLTLLGGKHGPSNAPGFMDNSLGQLRAELPSVNAPPEKDPVRRVHSGAELHQSNRSERRAFPRRTSGCTVSICRRDEVGPLTPQRTDWLLHAGRLQGKLNDISMKGCAFTLPEPLKIGEDLVLRFRNRALDRRIDVSAEVVRVSEQVAGQWLVHCRLARKLDFDEVQDLGRQLFASAVV